MGIDENELYSVAKHVWTDAQGNRYQKWSDLTDSHLSNVINQLERRAAEYVDKPLYAPIRIVIADLLQGATQEYSRRGLAWKTIRPILDSALTRAYTEREPRRKIRME